MGKSKLKARYFIGGLIITGAVVGIGFTRNHRLREVAQGRINSLMESGRKIAGQIQYVSSRIQDIEGQLGISPEDKEARDSQKYNKQIQDLDLQWEQIEEANRERLMDLERLIQS
jgi:hypothetical protein